MTGSSCDDKYPVLNETHAAKTDRVENWFFLFYYALKLQ